jgi:hypothetical protein
MDANHPTPNAPSPPAPTSPRRRPRRIFTYAILSGAVLTLLGVLGIQRHSRARSAAPVVTPIAAVPAPRAPEPGPIVQTPPAPPARPRVELVFALDTTSSMSGLIEGAKQKIWSIASFVAQGQPTPDLRVGLVGYRDVGDEYVTKVYDLDQDLDRVYRRLRNFRAEGGGDTPEHVARALDESVKRMSWSQAPEVVKVIYLVGDAAPHTDYHDGYDYARSARLAAKKGIALHTIECGNDHETEVVWRKIASLGGGQFMAIEQGGGVMAEHSKYDDELARLHDRLGETAIGYGRAAAALTTSRREAAAAPAPIKAARATYMANKGVALSGEGDLVDAIASGKAKLADVQAELPAELKAMDKDRQAAVIAAKQKEREEINAQIRTLSDKRRNELDAREAAAAKAGRADGFDVAAKKALKKSVDDNALSGFTLR